jgi:hypothetical protein
MLRALAVICLAAGVASPALVEAKAAKAAKAAKVKQAKPRRAKQAKQLKRSPKEKPGSRLPTKRSLARKDNMPRGFAWPPTRQMREAERACEAKLDELGVAYRSAPAEGRVADPIKVDGEAGAMTLGGVTYVGAFTRSQPTADCQLVLALARFGPQLHDLGVERVTFGSVFRWTNVRVMGKTKDVLSRHALGIAMDIISFTDHDGRVAYVSKDYPRGDELLLGVEAAVNRSGLFRVLLTPSNDPISHRDHFHLEVAADYTAPAS